MRLTWIVVCKNKRGSVLNFRTSLSEGSAVIWLNYCRCGVKHYSFEGEMYEFENTFYQSLKELIKVSESYCYLQYGMKRKKNRFVLKNLQSKEMNVAFYM